MRNLKVISFCLLLLVTGTYLFAGVSDYKKCRESSSTDTIIIFISNTEKPLYIDTLFISASDWQILEFDISGFNRESIELITFNPHHHGGDTGGFYMKEIALYGSDTLLIEDFAGYNPDTIGGPGQQFIADDRYWKVTLVWDGSLVDAAIIQGDFKFMHCFYSSTIGGEVGSTLHLCFSPNTKDWSQYSKICFTVRNNMPTGILPIKKPPTVSDMTVHKLRDRGLYITLPTKCEAADFYLYTVSGKLLGQKSYKRNGPFFWQLPFIPNGAYILTVDDGVNTYSDVITIEK
jgi:hypothetical protein